MVNFRLILPSVLAVCIAGCNALPFFSSDANLRNPVPKPEWEQSLDRSETKDQKVTSSEKKRTPSVVWIPESQIRPKNSGAAQNRITGSDGQPILSAMSECIRPGYSLLDGVECDAEIDAQATAESTGGTVTSGSNESSQLDTDLLGGTPVPNTAKSLPPEPKMVETSVATELASRNNQGSESQNDQIPVSAIPVAATNSPARLMPARYERIVLSSDLVFEFAKFGLEGLSSAGQTALRGLRERFAKYDPTSFRKVVITGHADRLGKPKSNVAVSQLRASAIKSLLTSSGIDPDILEAVGVGSVSPVAHCPGKRKTAKLKSCLAPNRRVEIEIIGAT